MSLYWRKFKTSQNIELPEKIMRPFWHPVVDKLDDEVCSMGLSHERPLLIPYLILSLVTYVLFYSINGIIEFSELFPDYSKWHEDEIYTLLTFSITFIIAGILFYLALKMTTPRHLEFNRYLHSVHSPKNSLLPSYFDHDYDDLMGAIECYKNLFGKRKSWLVLKHKSEQHKIRLYYTYGSPQELVGYWSFIVQYMKKDAPLPAVPALYSYPNKIEGVASSTSFAKLSVIDIED